MRGAEDTHIVSTWGADGVVYVWDVQQMLRSLDGPLSGASGVLPTAPVAKLTRHTDEGFAMDWCALKPGRLATGDCKGQVFLTELHSNGAWVQGDVPYTSHRQSVEDLQWSPKEVDVFASCSVDHTIKIWYVLLAVIVVMFVAVVVVVVVVVVVIVVIILTRLLIGMLA